MYTIYVTEKFSAAHQLIGYEGECSQLHGHTFTVNVWLTGNKLNSLGMLVDFKKVKEVIKQLDHTNLNDVLVEQPTAEYIAYYIYNELKKLGFPVKKVRVWESNTASVEYYEKE